MLQNPTLAEMTQSLKHGLDAPISPGSSDTKKAGKGKKGKSDFDESKVKRDGEGQFSKKEGADKPITPEEARKIDGLWMADKDSLESLRSKIFIDSMDALMTDMQRVADKHGITGSLDEIADQIEANPEVYEELNESSLKIVNETAKKEGISPSGAQRVGFTLEKVDGKYKPVTTIVPYSGPNPNASTSASLLASQRRSAAIAKADRRDKTPMFNPTADISEGRVMDTSDSGYQPKEDPWYKRMLQSANPSIEGVIPPTLSEMRHTLKHGFDTPISSGSSDTKKAGKGKKGKGDFDESKVKRDGEGQFAKKAAGDKSELDKEWRKGAYDKLDSFLKDDEVVSKRLDSVIADTMKAYGFKKESEVENASEKIQKAFTKTFSIAAVKVVNTRLRESPSVSVSPSGNERAECVAPNNDLTKIQLRIIDVKTGTVVDTLKHDALTSSPTLSEMRHDLDLDEPQPPTLDEMRHALETPDDVLAHFGIKGMKWGVRRSRALLGRNKNVIKDDEGVEVGGIKARSLAAATKLRNMTTGQVMVIDTVDAGPKVLVKQRDGSFKEAHISADAQSVLRTVNKNESEMSTREIGEANKRAKAIEEYNKIFNPLSDPNAELKAKVDAMELQQKYSAAYAKMNPTRAQRVGQFVKDLSPAFDTYTQIDRQLGNALSNNLKAGFVALKGAKTVAGTTTAPNSQNFNPNQRATKFPKPTPIYDISDVGGGDYGNPYIARIER